jgi:hypothetical protein
MVEARCNLYFATMLRNAVRPVLVAAVLVAVAACGDSVEPSLTVELGRGGRGYSVREDSLAILVDSVRVELAGPGADTARWVAAHTGAGALALIDRSGRGSGWLRFARGDTLLGEGLYLDTLAVAVLDGGPAPALLIESLTVRAYPTTYVVVKRAWLPGERANLVSQVLATRAFALPYVGDVSDHAEQLIPLDSTFEIVTNPALPTTSRPSRFGPRLSTMGRVPAGGWTLAGIKVRLTDTSGTDVRWLGYFFYNNADPTWKGIMLGATGAAAVNQIINTPAFDASFGLSGGGGGEAQLSSNTYWQGNGGAGTNRLRVTASSFGGTPVTLTSGPFMGGTMTVGSMTGSMQTIVLTRMTGSAGDAADTVNVSASGLTSYYFQCDFPTPCTTNALMAPQLRAWLTR